MSVGRTPQGQGGGFALLLTRCDAGCRKLAHAMLLVSGWGVLFMGVLIAVDVIWRGLSGHNLGGVDEIASYLLAISISWSLASAFYARAHIRVDLLYRKCALPLRGALDAVATLSLLGVAVFLLFSSWTVFSISWGRGSNSASSLQIPLVVPQAIWVMGMLVFFASLLIAWVRLMTDLLSRQSLEVVRRHGVLSADEEATDALTQSRGGK
ncbi:TRAP transporter small permease [Roseovarius aestuarii]|nr:TRAP transporter small permease [Roseovarius aestuarii]